MDKPYIYLFKTRKRNYIYDVNTNAIISINAELYNLLNNAYIIDSEEIQKRSDLKKLIDNGYLSSSKVKIIEHPKTPFLSHMLEYQLNTLTLQVTQQCNLRCEYCVYSGQYKNREHSNKWMDFKTAKQCIDYVIDHSVDSEELHFSFYGGEPLLNFTLIKQCVEYIKQAIVGRKVIYNITTNGTLLTDEILEFFEKENFLVMISLDGDKDSHNKNRKFATNNMGTFDVIIKNIIHIKECYPKIMQNLNFNVVLDSENDFDKINSFYTSFEAIDDFYSIRSTLINTMYRKEINKEINDDFYSKRGYEIFKLLLSRLGRFDDMKVSKLVKDYYVNVYFNTYYHRGLSKGLPETSHPGGPCVPGIQRLFADVEGRFFPCERVSEESDLVNIGDCINGIDVNKASQILNVGKIGEENCKNCWNFRFCNMCVASVDEIKEFSLSKKMGYCETARSATRNQLLDYCTLIELGYDFTSESAANYEDYRS